MSATPAITGATGLTGEVSRAPSADSLKKAGQKFEAMFTGMMLKTMRQAKLADPLFSSKAIDTFTEMSDAKVAAAMAEHQPLGIGKALTDYLAKSQSAAGITSDSGDPGDPGGDKTFLNQRGASASP